MNESEQAQAYLRGQEQQRAARKAYDGARTQAKAAQAQIDKGKAMYLAGTKMMVDAYELEEQLANDTKLTHHDAQAVDAKMRKLRKDARRTRMDGQKERRAGEKLLRAARVAQDKASKDARIARGVVEENNGAPRPKKPSHGFDNLLAWEEA